MFYGRRVQHVIGSTLPCERVPSYRLLLSVVLIGNRHANRDVVQELVAPHNDRCISLLVYCVFDFSTRMVCILKLAV